MAVEGWEEAQLGDLVDIKKGKKVDSHEKFSEGYVPYIGAENFSGKITKYAPPNNAVLCTNQDVLMLWDGERSGLVSKNWQGAVSSTVARLSSKGKIDPKFLYHFLNHKFEWIQSNRTGQAVPHVPKNLAKMLVIPVPIQLEQKKIAEILESVDDAIAKTESVIAQTQRMKQGLLQQLLTRGIGHTKLKQTELGEIPESWEIKTLADTGKWSGGGTPSKQNPNFWVGSIPWVSPKDMKAKVITETEDYISNEAIQGSATSLLPKGTILIVTRSGILRHTLPIAMAGVDLAVNQDLKTIQVCSPFLMRFVFYWLQANSEKILKECSKEGTTVESIETDTFKKFLITMPPRDEQEKIISIIDSLQNFDEAEVQKLKFLRTIKSGLMSDLLTGRVRVKVDTKTPNKIEEAA